MLQLPPGTHHLKFIVDSEMRTSKDLPTAVDFTNVLVNYIEVSADDIPRPRRESEKGAKNVPTNLRPPQVLPEEEEEDDDQTPQDEQGDFFEEEVPVGDFRQLVPQAYNDIELPEDDPRFQQAYHVIGDTPGPPSLPLFLVKSILNGVLPLKDDSSVLGLPNHTVLNHLATSSIKNNVLATSVTTRYKDKVSLFALLLVLPLTRAVCDKHHVQACACQRGVISRIWCTAVWLLQLFCLEYLARCFGVVSANRPISAAREPSLPWLDCKKPY